MVTKTKQYRLEGATGFFGWSDPGAQTDPPPLEWWERPVPGWRRGLLHIRNVVTCEETLVDLKTGEIRKKGDPDSRGSL